ncbi:hypothetical protein AVCANL279_07320 [Campylobacter canadensis]|uniref:helix-turn-helix domain-containing protein n=1 Tax=Campylobacter canadensis TaxID=449520 RepID=UPI001557AD25|nr:helix-turn-helix domain-containing protein [Campylobacter canadensis]MBZ7995175.1 hypothetical protein [Campylobacter canadensis]MBZ7997128.1 hypothetical protein [Campylobacter canadensis]MBZ8000539.1 hypothetical protein [Campylobacter canadensis]MBZ8003850.1 hypothetical protein [Campylobacter canadensis]
MSKKELKIQARTYYETHLCSVKDVAKEFNINEKTLYHWIKSENWQQGSISVNLDKNELVQGAIMSQIDAAKENVKNELKAQFNNKKCLFDESIIDTTSDEILLTAMSSKMIDKTLVEYMYMSKASAVKLYKHATSPKEQKEVINALSAAASIAESVKKSIHGKDVPSIALQINNNNVLSSENLAELSSDELRRMLNEIKKP